MCNVCRSKLCSSTRWRSAARTGEMVHLRCESNAFCFVYQPERPGWFILRGLKRPADELWGWRCSIIWIISECFVFISQFIGFPCMEKKWMNFLWCFLFDVEQRVHNNAHYPLSFHTSVTPGLINCKREVKTVCLHDYRIGSMHQLRLFAKTIITWIL